MNRVRRFLPLFLLMAPGLLYLFINNYVPMAGLIIAFKDVDFAKGILASDWVGLNNFTYLFASEDAWLITRNTLFYNAAFIAFNTVLALIVALLLNEVKKAWMLKVYQSVILIPTLVSMVIVSYVVLAFLSSESGLLNKAVLPLFGLPSVSWYNTPEPWPFILVLVNAWKNVGFLTIIFYAAIIGIEHELYEAAAMDGATKLKQVFTITLPLIAPVVIMMVMLMIGRIFYSDFGLFYQVPLDSGTLNNVTNVIDTYVYRALIQVGDIGMSSAAGFYQSLVGFLMVLASNLFVRRFSKENALF